MEGGGEERKRAGLKGRYRSVKFRLFNAEKVKNMGKSYERKRGVKIYSETS